MHGNVFEWCEDKWHPNYQGAPKNGSAWILGRNNNNKVIQGGSWISTPVGCRLAFRSCSSRAIRSSSLGFRVVGVVFKTT